MAMAKIVKAASKVAGNIKKKKPVTKKPTPTFQSEVRALKAKAMTDAARLAAAKRIAKKYKKDINAVMKPKAVKKAGLKAIENRAKKRKKPQSKGTMRDAGMDVSDFYDMSVFDKKKLKPVKGRKKSKRQ